VVYLILHEVADHTHPKAVWCSLEHVCVCRSTITISRWYVRCWAVSAVDYCCCCCYTDTPWSVPYYLLAPVCLFLCLSVSLSVCLTVCLSVCLSLFLPFCQLVFVSLSVCLYVYVSLKLFVCLCLSLSLSQLVSLSVCLYVCLSLSTALSVCLCLSLSVNSSVYLSVCLSVCCAITLQVTNVFVTWQTMLVLCDCQDIITCSSTVSNVPCRQVQHHQTVTCVIFQRFVCVCRSARQPYRATDGICPITSTHTGGICWHLVPTVVADICPVARGCTHLGWDGVPCLWNHLCCLVHYHLCQVFSLSFLSSWLCKGKGKGKRVFV